MRLRRTGYLQSQQINEEPSKSLDVCRDHLEGFYFYSPFPCYLAVLRFQTQDILLGIPLP